MYCRHKQLTLVTIELCSFFTVAKAVSLYNLQVHKNTRSISAYCNMVIAFAFSDMKKMIVQCVVGLSDLYVLLRICCHNKQLSILTTELHSFSW